jgi:cytoskeletal protein CcmA (bactofilin family)
MKFGSGSQDSKTRSGDMTGFLGEGVELKGDIVFRDTLRVDGKITGTIHSDGELVVGPTGRVEADITAGSMAVSGTVRGTVRVKERLEIHTGGRVEGDVLLAQTGLVVHDGGVIEAKIQMGAEDSRESLDPMMKSKAQDAVLA